MSALFLLGIVFLVWTSNGELHEYSIESRIFCYKCNTYHLGLCYNGMASCNLQYRESCATENIYILSPKGRSIYYYSKLSCMANCEEVNFLGFNRRTELICCKHRVRFCNKCDFYNGTHCTNHMKNCWKFNAMVKNRSCRTDHFYYRTYLYRFSRLSCESCEEGMTQMFHDVLRETYCCTHND